MWYLDCEWASAIPLERGEEKIMGRLSGKVAIITGAAGGQGEAEARRFVAEGARVAITDIQERGKQVAAELGDAALFLHHDVSDSAAWTRVVSETLRRFGKLDALVNNAAMFNPKTLVDTSAAELEQHFRVNQLGVFLGMKAVIEPLQATKGGSIVNIASVSAMRAIPGQFAYAASKWAVRGMTGNAAFELARLGIRVNAVYPGLIKTPMIAGTRKRPTPTSPSTSRWVASAKQTKWQNLSPFWSRTRPATSTAPRSRPMAAPACKRISRSCLSFLAITPTGNRSLFFQENWRSSWVNETKDQTGPAFWCSAPAG
jgi:3alpha(or 20beta)-hydroxysteroid dehydrogenase